MLVSGPSSAEVGLVSGPMLVSGPSSAEVGLVSGYMLVSGPSSQPLALKTCQSACTEELDIPICTTQIADVSLRTLASPLVMMASSIHTVYIH